MPKTTSTPCFLSALAINSPPVILLFAITIKKKLLTIIIYLKFVKDRQRQIVQKLCNLRLTDFVKNLIQLNRLTDQTFY